MRKFWFAYLAKALVVFPGGFGTMDELFEILTLVQTQKLAKNAMILYGSDYWKEVINFDALAKWTILSITLSSQFLHDLQSSCSHPSWSQLYIQLLRVTHGAKKDKGGDAESKNNGGANGEKKDDTGSKDKPKAPEGKTPEEPHSEQKQSDKHDIKGNCACSAHALLCCLAIP